MTEDALAEELSRKEAAVNRMLELTRSQQEAIRRGEIDRVALLDGEKQPLIDKMSELDNSIKPFILRNKKYPASIRGMVEKINNSLTQLIDIEKQNAKMLSDLEMSASGRHIEAYKKAAK